MSSEDRRRHHRTSRDRSPFDERRRHRSRDDERRHHVEKPRVRIKEEPRDETKSERPSKHEERPRFEERRKRWSPNRRRNKSEERTFEWGKKPAGDIKTEVKTEEGEQPKEKPNFGLSGNLAKDTNTFNGVVVKYNEPPEARKPKLRWRLYPFKGEEELPFVPIHRQSAYLFGRDRRVADIPVDHPSCSKQHAVLQYRLIKRTLDDGTVSRRVRPYVIDLGSANGTHVNNKKIESERYYELFEKDVIKFGFSTRDYVLLYEHLQEEAVDDADKDEAQNEDEADKEKQEKGGT